MATTSAVKRWWRIGWLAAGVLAVLVPAAAFAQAPCTVPLVQAQTPGLTSPGSIVGVLNETGERTKLNQTDPSPLNQGSFIDGMRVAHATENGALLPQSACGTMAAFAGGIFVRATSRIPATDNSAGALNLGVGPISGTFRVDGAEGRIQGSLTGVLDFLPTNLGQPVVPTSGSWSAEGGRNGSFVGVALVPFQNPYAGGAWFYYDPTGILANTPGTAAYVPLDAVTDFNKEGLPEAKFIINMFD